MTNGLLGEAFGVLYPTEFLLELRDLVGVLVRLVDEAIDDALPRAAFVRWLVPLRRRRIAITVFADKGRDRIPSIMKTTCCPSKRCSLLHVWNKGRKFTTLSAICKLMCQTWTGPRTPFDTMPP